MLLFISFFQLIQAFQSIQELVQSIEQQFQTDEIAQIFLHRTTEQVSLHDQYFKKYLSLLEKIDDLYDQQEKLLAFNEANIEYVIKRSRKNYVEQINQILKSIEQNNEQNEKIVKNIEENKVQEQAILSSIVEITSTISLSLKDNFSLNFNRVMPMLTQKIQSGFFEKLQRLRTLDYQLLMKELNKFKQFGEQVKESKKKDLAYCYSIIGSVLKHAQILIMQEFMQSNMEQAQKLGILREDNKQLSQQLLQLRRIKRLVEDSQEFKLTLIKQYKESSKLIQVKKSKFRTLAKIIIEQNEQQGKLHKQEETQLKEYLQIQ